jgi:hypothetical protein
MIDGNVSAAVTDGRAETVVPIGAMNRIVAVVKHCVRYVRHVIAFALHSGYVVGGVDREDAGGGGGGGFSGGDDDGVDAAVSLPGDQALGAEVDLDPVLGGGFEIVHLIPKIVLSDLLGGFVGECIGGGTIGKAGDRGTGEKDGSHHRSDRANHGKISPSPRQTCVMEGTSDGAKSGAKDEKLQ